MLALIEVTISIVFLAAIIFVSAALGFFVNSARLKKQKSAVAKLETEMLQSHAEILQLQKELSDKESLQSRTPIFSIHDNGVESSDEQINGATRLTKKIAGERGKSTS